MKKGPFPKRGAFLFFVLFLAASALSLRAQEDAAGGAADSARLPAVPAERPGTDGAGPEAGAPPGGAQTDGEYAGAEYVVREVEFAVEGRARPDSLFRAGEFEIGERIKGKENLDKYLARKTQLLMNQQVFEEAEIEYAAGPPEEDGALPIKLLVRAKDSNNFVVLPYPKYDSNEGFSFTVKARDYNFLGTLSPLSADVGYRNDGGEQSVFFELDSDTPFQAFGLRWNVNFDHIFEYAFDGPLSYQNVTGLSVELPWRSTAFTVGFNQYLTINEEIPVENKDPYGLADERYDPYGATELFASWDIPLGIELGDFGELAYKPGVSGTINYPYAGLDASRKPQATFSHSVGFGGFDWIGNYRKGLSVSVGNANTRFFDRADAPLRVSVEGAAIAHWPLAERFGVSSRIQYRHWRQWSGRNGGSLPYYYAGDAIRGIIDEFIRANSMLSLNIDFPIRAFRFRPSEWLKNPKLRFFDVEVHLSPFADLALFEGRFNKSRDEEAPFYEKAEFKPADMASAAGLEIIVFSDYFRSLKLRASFGYDIKKVKEDGLPLKGGFFPGWNEIYVGLDHSY